MSLESGYSAKITVHSPQGDFTLLMETWEDGNLAANSARHRDPVTRKETARGGTRTREALTLTRECDAATWALIPRLEDAVGRDRCTCVRQQLGPRAEAIGKPETRTGLVNGLTPPGYDLSGDSVSMIEIEIDVDE